MPGLPPSPAVGSFDERGLDGLVLANMDCRRLAGTALQGRNVAVGADGNLPELADEDLWKW